MTENPTHSQPSARRSTLALLDAVTIVRECHRVPLLTGNSGDLFVAPSGTVYGLPHLLAHDAASRGVPTVVFSLARGSHALAVEGGPMGPGLRHVTTEAGEADALADLFGQLAAAAGPVMLLIDYSDLLLPASGAADGGVREQERMIELLAEQALTQAAQRTVHNMVVLTRTGAGPDQRLAQLPGFEAIPVGLPNLGERMAMIARLRAPQVGQPLRLAADLDEAAAARLTGGLANMDLVQARDLCAATGAPLTRSWIQQRKSQTIARLAGPVLVVHPPGNGLADVAGLPQVRLLVEESRATGRPLRRILLAGPPGVGKSLVVRAIADELGLPVVALGTYRNPLVGETERQFRLALRIVQDLAPCVLWIDEIDQALGQRNTGQSSDGGTSERVLADMWNFLGDNTLAQQVTVIGTTNRPEILDPAMFDRFEVVPVLHPTPAEAADVLRIAAAREDRTLDPRAAQQEVEHYGQMVTGRVLVSVMDRAITLADQSAEPLASTHLRMAFDELLTAVDEDEHVHLALRSIALTTFSSRLPWEAARRLGLEVHVPDYLAGIVDPVTGTTDRRALSDALRGGPVHAMPRSA